MNFTRVIAVSVFAAAMSTLAAQAGSLRDTTPPAEFPPASFKGMQFVDSRGCIYIRAGIDGNVTWVPRVTRDRKQVCGYQPTQVAGATATPAKPAGPAPVTITLPPEARPGAEDTPPVVAQAPAPKPAAQQAPRPLPAAVAAQSAEPALASAPAPVSAPAAQRRPSPGPEPTVFSSAPRRQAAAAAAPSPAATPVAASRPRPAAPVRRPSPGPQPTVFSSASSRPAQAAPVIAPRLTAAGQPQRLASLTADTRVVPRHVYEMRGNTNSFTVPAGYRPVWSDDRLNPHRAEFTLRAAQPRAVTTPPAGYIRAERDDDRLNPKRGLRRAEGDARTNLIWTQTVPRRLIAVPVSGPVVQLSKVVVPGPASP